MNNTNQIIETYKNDPSKMLFWHGGNLQDTIKTEYKKGQYEFGPGLYAITNYTSAKKYSKGSRRLYLLVIDKGTDLKSAYLDQPVVEEFVKNNVVGKLQKEVFDRLSKYFKDGKLKAYLLNNILLNLQAIRGSSIANLRQFYIDNGIDYEIVQNPFGWGESMIVLYNMKKIEKTIVVDSKEKLDTFDLPSINESHFMTFLDKLQTTHNKSLIESIKLGFNTLFESDNGEYISLNELYEGDLPDRSEMIYNFIDNPFDWDLKFKVKEYSVEQLKQLEGQGSTSVYDDFKTHASKEQKQIVKSYIDNDNKRNESPVVIANKTLLDGHHRVVAAIIKNVPIKGIDVYSDEVLTESINESNSLSLYHGTCKESALNMINNGWSPNSSSQGSNLGNPKYLYLSSEPEDALWFAQEKGCDVVLKISNIPLEYLIPDPEDEAGYSMNDLLKQLSSSQLPAKFALTKPLSKEHFSLYNKSLTESVIGPLYHGTNNKFDTFNSEKIGSGNGANWNASGFYFSDNKTEAYLYGNKLIKADIQLNNPIDLTKVNDSSVNGSGFIKLITSLKGFENIKYEGKLLSDISKLIQDLEDTIDLNKISFSEGSNENFKHVWYEYEGKEYVLRNKTQNEINNKQWLKAMIISNILYEKYDMSGLPTRVSELMNPSNFTAIAKENGYDGVIASNSTVPNGNEYVVFDNKNIKIIDNPTLTESIGPVYHGTGSNIDEFKYEFTGKGADGLGSGFYFTNNLEDAKFYGTGGFGKVGENPNVIKAELDITKPLDADKNGSLTPNIIAKFLKRAPDLKTSLENYGDVQYEGFSKVFRYAVDSYVSKNENILAVLNAISNDFYKDDVKEFNKAVKEILGYDGIYKKYDNSIHYVAFFPEQIKILDRKSL